MVYCGKPSRGCQMCRTRRIKCDETKPTCNQCAKSRRQCPGYKDEFDLVFRNETQATERRVQKASRKAAALREQKEGARVTAAGTAQEASSSSAALAQYGAAITLPNPRVSVEDQATCHFISNFVLVPRQGGTRGFLDYLVPMLRSGEKVDKQLKHAFNACAYAHLDNRENMRSEKLGNRAVIEYTKALQATNIALKDPEKMKSDSTLASVLLLGLFENISAKQMGMLAWGTHIEGALEIVKQRGSGQVKTHLGLLLFIAVRVQMIIHSLSTGKAPIMGADWWMTEAVKDEVAAKCQRINIKTSEVRVEATRLLTVLPRTSENIELMLQLVRRAQYLDQECVKWGDSVPDLWRSRTVAWEDKVPNGDFSKAEVYPGRVDVYADFWIASVWNLMRVCRIVLASVTVRCSAWVCAPVDYRTTPEYATAARTCVNVLGDIIASVPYHLGWHLKRRDQLLRKDPTLSGFACGEEGTMMKGLSGYFLTWPLACIIGQDYTTDSQRAWAVGRLRYIGDYLGVKYAHILAELQIRVPSMLIRRDGLMATPYPAAHNFEQLLSSARNAKPAPGFALNPIQQHEVMQKQKMEKEKNELLVKATAGGSNNQTDWVAKKWLNVP